MIQVITAPERNFLANHPFVFMAGGITGCPEWQDEMIESFRKMRSPEKESIFNYDMTLLNPRRKNFPMDDPTAAERQIKWEHDMLRLADAILFWFPKETICPIVLYELGAWSMTDKPILVGVHPEYQRRQDVEIQTKLARPNVPIMHELGVLAAQVAAYATKYKEKHG